MADLSVSGTLATADVLFLCWLCEKYLLNEAKQEQGENVPKQFVRATCNFTLYIPYPCTFCNLNYCIIYKQCRQN